MVWLLTRASQALIRRRAFASTHTEDWNVPIIRANAGIITQINVFTVPGAANRIVDRLREGGWLDRNTALGEAHPGLYEVAFTLEK